MIGGRVGTYPPVAFGVLRDLPKWEGSWSVDGVGDFLFERQVRSQFPEEFVQDADGGLGMVICW